MMVLAVLIALGLPAGWLLLCRVPRCVGSESNLPNVAVIVPARNEERNLPRLLHSLATDLPAELIVVDDASRDRTAQVARAASARVLQSRPLPAHWTGKTWACFQGAQAAHADTLMFLDADTWFQRDGFARAVQFYATVRDGDTALSFLPYHVTKRPYEELSLFFNLLMAFGAGGFGAFGKPRLFGQSLLLSRELYNRCGAHAAVQSSVLENFAFSKQVKAAGGRCLCVSGRGVLNLRMFPDGLAQLREGWLKAFADGAADTNGAVLALSIYWLSALSAAFLAMLCGRGVWQAAFAMLYLALAFETYFLARQAGAYRFLTALLYPLPLAFFFWLFTQAAIRKIFNKRVTWRGREL